MPCNGLVYAPPHNCACYPEAKLFGLNALAPTGSNRQGRNPKKEPARLEKGPAYGKASTPKKINPSDWPTYRGNTNRSGKSNTGVSPELDPQWETEIGNGGRLSSVIVADGKLFVAEIDAHAVPCLDADKGKVLWTHVAGGRVDSPPTYHEGAVLFGSADGHQEAHPEALAILCAPVFCICADLRTYIQCTYRCVRLLL